MRCARPVLVVALCLAGAVPAAGQTFNPGIYYRVPFLDNPGARLARLDDPLLPEIQVAPVGWDMCGDVVVFPTPQGLVLRSASGQQRSLAPAGLFRLARPSFSPDCTRIAVQASATPDIIDGVEDLNIYVIASDTGAASRVGDLAWNEESPRFFPVGARLAYSSFSPSDGVNLHIYDLDLGREVLLARGIGALQMAISPNGDRIVDPRRMRIYDAATGAVVHDLLAPLVESLPAAGFTLDERFKDEPGMPNKGMYPLDAAFSPDGTELVLDWALRRGAEYGNVLMRLSIDARQLRVLTGLIPANPEFTNHNNFSQLNPVWK